MSIIKKKLECLQISKFLRFKMIWSSSFEKSIYGAKFCTEVWTLLKKRRLSQILTKKNNLYSWNFKSKILEIPEYSRLIKYFKNIFSANQKVRKNLIKNNHFEWRWIMEFSRKKIPTKNVFFLLLFILFFFVIYKNVYLLEKMVKKLAILFLTFWFFAKFTKNRAEFGEEIEKFEIFFYFSSRKFRLLNFLCIFWQIFKKKLF